MVRIFKTKWCVSPYPSSMGGNKKYVEGACNAADVATLPTDYANGSNMIVADASKIVVFDESAEEWVEWGAEE